MKNKLRKKRIKRKPYNPTLFQKAMKGDSIAQKTIFSMVVTVFFIIFCLVFGIRPACSSDAKIVWTEKDVVEKPGKIYFVGFVRSNAIEKTRMYLTREDVEMKDDSGNPLLLIAVAKGYYEMTKLLIEKGANINAPGAEGNTALHQSVIMGRNDIAQLLLEHGAQTELKNNAGETPFEIAKKQNNNEMLLLLSRVRGVQLHEQ